MLNVAICTPHTEMVRARTVWALLDLVLFTLGNNVSLTLNHRESSMLTMNRNRLVDQSMEKNVDYILFMDSDMIFPKDALLRLLAHKKDIVGCVYRRRSPPFDSMGDITATPEDIEKGNLVEAQRLPGGFVLISSWVFRGLPWPWYHERYNMKDKAALSEDYCFCDLARENGFKLYCDLGLSKDLAHIGELHITLNAPPEGFIKE
jgi:glycosyltransferase involved in cell wall biosynthesis